MALWVPQRRPLETPLAELSSTWDYRQAMEVRKLVTTLRGHWLPQHKIGDAIKSSCTSFSPPIETNEKLPYYIFCLITVIIVRPQCQKLEPHQAPYSIRGNMYSNEDAALSLPTTVQADKKDRQTKMKDYAVYSFNNTVLNNWKS